MTRPRLIAFLLALITFAVYSPAAKNAFLTYDDPDYVTENRMVQSGLTSRGVAWAFTTTHASNWHPLTWLSHMADCEGFGLHAGAHHLVNILFHAANTALLFLFLFRITGALWSAAIVAALFAWHPLHVESVAWVAERKDVLSTFFALLSLFAYAQYSEESNSDKSRAGVRSPKSKVLYAIALLLFALGLMAKPMLVTLPFVLLLLDYWPLRRRPIQPFNSSTIQPSHPSTLQLFNHSTVREKWPFFALAAASCVVTFLAQRAEAVRTLEQVPFGFRLGNAFVAYARYLFKTIWPADLSIIYPFPIRIPGWQIAGAVALLAAISAFAWVCRRRRPSIFVGWFWFVGVLVPVIGLVQVGGQAMADRYTYLPSIGLFVAVVYGTWDVAQKFRLWMSVATGVALAACVFATHRQLGFWRDSRTLFTRALAVTHNNALAHANLGFALYEEHRLDEAMVQYRRALEIQPGHFDAHNNLGIVLFEKGRVDEAIGHYETVLRLKPSHVKAHYNLANALLRAGKVADAIEHYDAAVRLSPDHVQARNNLAWVLSTWPEASVRNGGRALQLAREADVLTGGKDPAVLSTLAAAYAEAGEFTNAVTTAEKALRLAGAQEGSAFRDELRGQLEMYRAGKPVREGGPPRAGGGSIAN